MVFAGGLSRAASDAANGTLAAMAVGASGGTVGPVWTTFQPAAGRNPGPAALFAATGIVAVDVEMDVPLEPTPKPAPNAPPTHAANARPTAASRGPKRNRRVRSAKPGRVEPAAASRNAPPPRARACSSGKA